MTAHLLGWGNGYAEKQRTGRGMIAALWPIHPSLVKPRFNERDELVYDIRVTPEDAKRTGRKAFTTITMRAEDIFHVRGPSPDGVIGWSVYRLASESIGAAVAKQRFAASFFGNGTVLSGVLKHPAHLEGPAADRLRNEWQEMHGGSENANKTAVLEEGMEYQRLGVEPEAAQMLESTEFSVVDICRWFRMPPYKIGAGNASAGTTESQRIDYLTDTLMPWMVRWEQAINGQVLDWSPEHFVEHLAQAQMRGDHTARAAFYNAGLLNGWKNINEVRAAEGDNPVDGGDDHYVPLNTVPLDRAGEYADAVIAGKSAGAATNREPILKNPTGAGGGENNDPKQVARAMLRVFVAAAERVTSKAAKAIENRRKKGGDVAVWLGEFASEMAGDVRARIAEIAPAMVELLCGIPAPESALREAAHAGETCATLYADAIRSGREPSAPELAATWTETITAAIMAAEAANV
jgi:HK97 family phage portal protein